jgi:riboflavin biosynthesis pyrimidine reductase
MRILHNDVDPSVSAVEPDIADLARLYAYPEGRSWLRANMVSTLDGAATGADGRSGSINDAADRQVFQVLRALTDAVVVGAGTARAEGYAPASPPSGDLAALRQGRAAAPAIVVVSRSGAVPTGLRAPREGAGEQHGAVLLATCDAAGPAALDTARQALGEGNVLVHGGEDVDLAAVTSSLVERGMGRMLCEGGPHLLRDMTAAGLLDELCLTVVPRLVAGDHTRILAGGAVDTRLEPRLLLDAGGTLLGRWQLA